VIIRSVVVLPAPLGPSRPKIEPRLTENERSSTARTGCCRRPNVLTRWSTRIAGCDTVASDGPLEGGHHERRVLGKKRRERLEADFHGRARTPIVAGLGTAVKASDFAACAVVFRRDGFARPRRQIHRALEHVQRDRIVAHRSGSTRVRLERLRSRTLVIRKIAIVDSEIERVAREDAEKYAAVVQADAAEHRSRRDL